MWAITTNGIGKEVTARSIMPEWDLVEGEAFKAEHWEPGLVLAEDGISLTVKSAAQTLVDLKNYQRANVVQSFNQAMSAITSGYPQSEIDSWYKQEQEARAWSADNQTDTPLVDALALARDITKVELVSRIIAKADAFAGISGQLIGKRQGLEDGIEAATTSEEVEAVSW